MAVYLSHLVRQHHSIFLLSLINIFVEDPILTKLKCTSFNLSLLLSVRVMSERLNLAFLLTSSQLSASTCTCTCTCSSPSQLLLLLLLLLLNGLRSILNLFLKLFNLPLLVLHYGLSEVSESPLHLLINAIKVLEHVPRPVVEVPGYIESKASQSIFLFSRELPSTCSSLSSRDVLHRLVSALLLLLFS